MHAGSGSHLEGLGMNLFFFFSLFLLKGMESPDNLQLRAKLSDRLMQDPEESSDSSFGFSEWKGHKALVNSWQILFPSHFHCCQGHVPAGIITSNWHKQHNYSHSISGAPFLFLKLNPSLWGTSFSHAFLLKAVGPLIWINCGKLVL